MAVQNTPGELPNCRHQHATIWLGQDLAECHPPLFFMAITSLFMAITGLFMPLDETLE